MDPEAALPPKNINQRIRPLLLSIIVFILGSVVGVVGAYFYFSFSGNFQAFDYSKINWFQSSNVTPTITVIKNPSGPQGKITPGVSPGPGGCQSEEECKKYCEANPNDSTCQEKREQFCKDNPSECQQGQGVTGQTAGSVQTTGTEQPAGPGGCKTEEECKKYCKQSEHQTECQKAAQESCQQNPNQEICQSGQPSASPSKSPSAPR